MPRIVIGRISHETNTFSPVPTARASFLEGEGILEGAPGAANPNLDRFTFARIRRPIWPLDRSAAQFETDPGRVRRG